MGRWARDSRRCRASDGDKGRCEFDDFRVLPRERENSEARCWHLRGAWLRAYPEGMEWISIGGRDWDTLMVRELSTVGACMFKGVDSRERLIELVNTLGDVYHHRDNDSQGLSTLEADEGRASSSGAGFGRGALALHTDQAGAPDPPRFVLVMCERESRTGGDVVLADGQEAVLRMAEHELEILLGRKQVTYRGPEGYTYEGPVIQQTESTHWSIRLRSDVHASLCEVAGLAIHSLRRAALSSCSVRRLAVGEGYLVQNGRWLHGRNAFRGHRRVVRVLFGESLRGVLGRVRPQYGFPVPERLRRLRERVSV